MYRTQITERALACALGASLATAALNGQSDSENAYELDALTVTTATRVEKQISSIPQTISLVSEQDLREQIAISGDLIASLSQLEPSYSPSRNKMSGAGETFRGRSPLFMIDGVPQSNPLRDGSRDGYTIDPAMIERIEFVHGASAAQGMGATGGIINYVTKRAPAANGLSQWGEFGFSSSDQFESEGLGYRAAYGAGYRQDRLGLVGAVTYEWRPMEFDGEGRLVGVDNTQGDTMYSSTLDVYGKATYALAESQSVGLTFNRFKMKQDLEYVSVTGDAEAGLPVTSERGPTPGKPTQNDVTTLSASYRHNDLGGGKLSLDVFANDFAATFGGGTFATFIHNGETIFDQSENQSEKHGSKLTFVRDLNEFDVGIVTGLDYFSDQTQQMLVQTGRQWVPETTYESYAPYLQVDKLLGPVVLTAGARYEDAKLKVNDFTTLESYGSQFVSGGSPKFDEWLYNFGATYTFREGATLFASYAQGFGMPDVGRVLRGINEPGQDIDSYLNLIPIVTDNYETGLRWHSGALSGSISGYFSTSDFGSRLRAGADGIYSVIREKTETWGAEADLSYELGESSRFGGAFAWVEGKSDTDADNDTDTWLDGANIPPARLNLYWNQDWNEALQSRLQASNYFDRDSRGFDGYTLFDLLLSYRLAEGQLSFAIENLLDRQYITYYSQTVGNDTRYFAGPGRTFSARYSFNF